MMKKDGRPWALERGERLKMEHSLGASELLIWGWGEVDGSGENRVLQNCSQVSRDRWRVAEKAG